MNVLAIETSSSFGSLAVVNSDENISVEWTNTAPLEKGSKRSHSEVITEQLLDLLKTANTELSKIDLIAVSQGPGSFTGLRVGANLAKSLSYSLNKPIAAINSLKILAHAQEEKEHPLLIITNAYRNMVFWARYEYNGHWKELSEPSVSTLQELENEITSKHYCCGDGYDVYRDFFPEKLKENLEKLPSNNSPHAKSLGDFVIQNEKQIRTLDWKELAPLYIRASAAEEHAKAKN